MSDAAVFDALVAWVKAAEAGPGEGILTDLTIDRPCPLCGGTKFCPEGCPMATCILDYELAPHRRERLIREYEYRRVEEGHEMVLVSGRECDACNIFGQCMSCFPDGRERRRAHKQGGNYLIDSLPLYSLPGTHALTEPIHISVGRVRKAIQSRASAQLDLLGAAA